MLAAAPLWRGLADYASAPFGEWSAAFAQRQQHLVATLADWWPRLLATPHTLIHNDFNPRNVVLRATTDGLRLCAFDWELVGIGLPQRDLAEFLCFVAGERAADMPFVAALVESIGVTRSRRRTGSPCGNGVPGSCWGCGNPTDPPADVCADSPLSAAATSRAWS